MKNIILVFIIMISAADQLPGGGPGLTAVYENQRQSVKLKWNHDDKNIIAYALLRSNDEQAWTEIKKISLSQPADYRFITYRDENPETGKNFYRLKFFKKDGKTAFSNSIMVIIGKPGGNWIMFPVPVRDVLNLQYNGTALITGVIGITIQNVATQQVFHRIRLASTSRFVSIPVGNLGRGIYLVRIMVGNQVTWNQRFSK